MSLSATAPASTPVTAPSPDHILQLGLSFWASKTLLSAVEMEVFTELAKHPEDLETLTGRLGLHPRSSRDFLDALVALGFLERRDGIYSNTPSTDLFLDKHKPSYIGGMLEMANRRLFKHWGQLTTALRTGQPQGEAAGPNAETFASLYADPAAAEGISAGDDRREPGREPGDCGEVSLGAVQDGGRCGAGAGRSADAGAAEEPAPVRRRVRFAGGGSDF